MTLEEEMRSPDAASQRPAVAGPPVTTQRPSGLKDASLTGRVPA